MATNTFNDTIIRDDKKFSVGTSEDLGLSYNSVDARTEVSYVGTIFAHIIGKVMRWLDDERIEMGTGGDIRLEYDAATNTFQIQDVSGVALVTVDATTGEAEIVQKLSLLGRMGVSAAEHEIAGGAIGSIETVFVRVETPGGASSGSLDTISGGYDGQLLILGAADAGHTVIIRDYGNIDIHRICYLETLEDRILLMYDGDTSTWVEVGRGVREITNLGAVVDVTIATGAITLVNNSSSVRVDTEAAAATDNLDTITGGIDGDVIVITAANASRDVVLRHGIDNLVLAGDCTLADAVSTITLKKLGTAWLEVSRSENVSAISHGTYTPTGTTVANITTLTPARCQYMRVGSCVTVSGEFDVTATANSTYTRGRLTLPVASNLGATRDLAGTCAGITSTANNISGQVLADATNNEIEFKYVSDAAAAGVVRTFSFSCTYTII